MYTDLDREMMARALELAARGQGYVEPNPMVGCLIAHDEEVVGEGWHQRYGGPHAEVEAIRMAGRKTAGATAYVTLEPCCHHGKTPPCSQALLDAGIRRVVVAARDPFPQVDGGGIRQLSQAGLTVEVGLMREESESLNRPYLKLVREGRPWVIAKWAMTLDGKMATRTGSSQWISGEASRKIVHQLRGRVDAIIVGRGTMVADDPQLIARPPGPRTATRIVLDRTACLSPESHLVRTLKEAPLMLAAGPAADRKTCHELEELGVEVWQSASEDPAVYLKNLLDDLGKRRMTNVLVEGGSQVLGALFDADMINEAHVFIAPKLAGGEGALSPIGGIGIADMPLARRIDCPEITMCDSDVYIQGRISPITTDRSDSQ